MVEWEDVGRCGYLLVRVGAHYVPRVLCLLVLTRGSDARLLGVYLRSSTAWNGEY